MGRPVGNSSTWSAPFLAAIALALSACSGDGSPSGTIVRDSAGIELIRHSGDALAHAPVWTIDTSEHLWTVGGGDGVDQDVDAMSCATLVNGEVWVCHQNPHELRRYDGTGRVVGRFGRKGMGPGEFQSVQLLTVRGDTFDLWDRNLQRLTSYRTSGELAGTVSYNQLPMSRTSGVRGRLRDGRLVALAFAWPRGDRDLDGARVEMPVFLLSPDGTETDSLPGHPGFRQYRGVVYEGGESFPSQTTYHLDGPSVMAVGLDGFTVAVPDTAEVIWRMADGAVQRIVRLGLPRRALTETMRETYIARDSAQYAATSPQFAGDMVRNFRQGRFVSQLTPFERMHTGPDGELWLERTWLGSDRTKEFIILDRHGMIAGILTLPMARTLWWIGTDAVLTSWRDDDDVRHLSLHPLRRSSALK